MTAHYDPAKYAAARVEAIARQAVVRPDAGLLPPLLSRPGLYRSGLKRGVDLLLVCLSAPVSLVVVLILALAVRLQGGKPFYSQDRVGQGGRIFRLWKLRTMVPDADARLEAHLAATPAARAEWDHCQKLKDDPRITPLGRILRKTSLDELPQLWNVFLGDMSLVGPRPMMPCQEQLYPGEAYYEMRPGITGPWQVSARNETGFAERARYDADYLARMSFLTDLRLLAATVRVVLRSTGH